MNDHELDSLIRQSHPRMELPASFNREVWERVSVASPASVLGGWREIAEALFLWISRPAPAVAVIALMLVIPKIKSFQREGLVVKTLQFTPIGEVLSLQINQNEEGMKEENIFGQSLRIVSYKGQNILLRQRFKARGGTTAEAKANAKAASLEVVQRDSTLIFNEEMKVDPAVPFRAQTLEMVLFLPEGTRFRMDPALQAMLENDEMESGAGEERDFYDENQIWTIQDGMLMPADKTSPVLPDSSSLKN